MPFRALPLAALCLSLVASVRAEDAADLFKKVDAAVYNPAEHGLKDLRVEYHDSMWAMNPQTAQMSVTLYWKAPDKRKADVQGAQGMVAAMLQKRSAHMVGMVVPEPNLKKMDNYDFQVSTEGGQTKVVGTLKTDAPEPEMPKKTTIFFDERGLPVKQVMEVPTGGEALTEMTYLDKDGKFMPDSVTMTTPTPMGQMKLKMTYSYKQVEGVWLPEKVQQEAMGIKGEITFENYQVNKGVDDAVFDGK